MVGAGLFAVIAGVVFIIFREQVAQRNRKNIEAKFGQNFGGSKRSTPAMMVWLGALFIALGAGILANAIWG